MKSISKWVFITLLAIFFSTSNAQDLAIGLSDLLARADSGSTALRASRAGISVSRETLENTRRSTLLPEVTFSASLGYLGNGYGWGRDSNYSFTVPMPHISTRFGVDVQQVIYAGGAARAARRQAELGVRLSELGYGHQRQELRLQLAGLYMDLYRAVRQLEVYDSNIALTRRLIGDIRARHEQGTALKNDLTRYELQLATLQMQRTRVENDLAIANSQIVTLAGLSQSTRVIPDSSFLAAKPDLFSNSNSLSSTLPVQMAEAKADLAGQQLKQSRSAMLPYLALVAQDQLNGPVTIDITPYNINYNYWFVGLSLNYNLSSLWKSNPAVRTARFNREQALLERQAVEEQTRQELGAAAIRLDEARRNLTIKQKSMQLAAQNYALVADRYTNELALLVDMIDAANQKLAAELDMVSARIEVVYRGYVIDYINGKL